MKRALVWGIVSVVVITSVMLWRETPPVKKHTTLSELSHKWPLGIDSDQPLLLINSVPMFRVHYIYAQRTLDSNDREDRANVLPKLIKAELLRQFGAREVTPESPHYSLIIQRPQPQDNVRDIVTRLRAAREIAYDQLSELTDERDPVMASVTPSSEPKQSSAPVITSLSLDCYHVPFASSSPLDRLNILDQLRGIERRLRQRRVSFTQVSQEAPRATRFLRLRRARLGGDQIPQELSELLLRRRDIRAGTILPLLEGARGAWLVYVKSRQTHRRPDHVVRPSEIQAKLQAIKHRSALDEILKSEREQAIIEVPRHYLSAQFRPKGGVNEDQASLLELL